MRMRFPAESDDEDEFLETRDALLYGFGTWAPRSDVRADPLDVKLLLTWRYSYSDGILDVWTCADVEEFLLEWCPRKLVELGPEIEGLPAAAAAWVEFLADKRHARGWRPTGSDPGALRGDRAPVPRRDGRCADRAVRRTGSPHP